MHEDVILHLLTIYLYIMYRKICLVNAHMSNGHLVNLELGVLVSSLNNATNLDMLAAIMYADRQIKCL